MWLENVAEDISSFCFCHMNLCLCFSQYKLEVGGHEMNIDYCRDDISTVNEDDLIWVWWRKFLTKDFAGKNENSLWDFERKMKGKLARDKSNHAWTTKLGGMLGSLLIYLIWNGQMITTIISCLAEDFILRKQFKLSENRFKLCYINFLGSVVNS